MDPSRPDTDLLPFGHAPAGAFAPKLLYMEAGRILVSIGDNSLARVLALWLAEALPDRTVVRSAALEALPGDTVLVTPSDCLPEAAAVLVSHGSPTVILTPVPRPTERDSYLAAGASYVVMSVDNAALLQAVRAGADGHSVPPPDFRPASSQRVSPHCSA